MGKSLPQCRGSRLMNVGQFGGGIRMWSSHCRQGHSNSNSNSVPILTSTQGLFLIRCVGAGSTTIINLPLMPDLTCRSPNHPHTGRLYLCIWYLRIWGLACVDFLDSRGNTSRETAIALRGLALALTLALALVLASALDLHWTFAKLRVVTAAKWVKTSEKLPIAVGAAPGPGESPAHARVCDRFADYFGDRFSVRDTI